MKARWLFAIAITILVAGAASGQNDDRGIQNPVDGYPGDSSGGCSRCVVGDWDGTGQLTPQCKNMNYSSQWPAKSPCQPVINCYYLGGVGWYCEYTCSGNDCLSV